MPRLAAQNIREQPENLKTLQAKCKVLLVDDSRDSIKLIEAYLDDPGISLTSAENGPDGIAAFQEQPFDLVLMDMQMPGMDGYEATRKIRKWETENRIPATPIAALTAMTDFTASSKSLSCGCTLHLAKPIRRQTLLQIVGQYASPRPASPQLLSDFLASSRQELESLRDAIDAEDPHRVVTAARRLKPIALACGPAAVGELEFILAGVPEHETAAQAVERLGRFLDGPVQSGAKASATN